jgi:hypothetical protein
MTHLHTLYQMYAALGETDNTEVLPYDQWLTTELA